MVYEATRVTAISQWDFAECWNHVDVDVDVDENVISKLYFSFLYLFRD